jgi:hypothetical protein
LCYYCYYYIAHKKKNRIHKKFTLHSINQTLKCNKKRKRKKKEKEKEKEKKEKEKLQLSNLSTQKIKKLRLVFELFEMM